MIARLIGALLLVTVTTNAAAAVHTETVEYHDGTVVLEGYLAYDDSTTATRPGILIVHEWMGLGPYAKRRAEQLAQLGYVAFAADMYGKGVRAADHAEAAKLAGIYKSDRRLMRARIAAALEQLKSYPMTDARRLAVIGYCFGGTAALELARSGADILGVVTFHGALDTPHPEDATHIKARLLICHGGDDPYVHPADVERFKQEMDQAGVRYRVIVYPGAVHSFTVAEAGGDPSKGMAYNAAADHASWDAMQAFFKEIFAESEVQNVG